MVCASMYPMQCYCLCSAIPPCVHHLHLPTPHRVKMSAKQGRNTATFKRLVQQLKREQPWICHLCHAPIPTDVHHTHPLAYTADHVVPMALAPWLAEDMQNLRPAHRICNLRKGKNPNSRIAKFSRKWQ